MRFLLTKLSHFFIFFLGLSVTAPLDRKAHCARKDIPAIHSLYEILEYPGLELKI